MSPQLVEIETLIISLPHKDQLLLVERLMRRLRTVSIDVRHDQLAAMAADPEIIAELATISSDFEAAELDGLDTL